MGALRSTIAGAFAFVLLSSPSIAETQEYDIPLMVHEIVGWSGGPIYGGWKQVGTMSLSWDDSQSATSIPVHFNVDLSPWVAGTGATAFVTSASINFTRDGLAVVPDSVSSFSFSGNSTAFTDYIPVQPGIANTFALSGSIAANGVWPDRSYSSGEWSFADAITIAVPIPEPTTYAMLLAGLALLSVVTKRRVSRAN